jgi:secretion/DNA translocation related TadE-like protein
VSGRWGSAQRGSATVWVAVGCLAIWLVAFVALSIGGAVAARHRAESGADLAALAGARTLAYGVGDPCAEAQRVATATRARLVSCVHLPDGSFEVVVEVGLPGLLARWPHLPPARARSRAGPASGAGGPSSPAFGPVGRLNTNQGPSPESCAPQAGEELATGVSP